MPWNWPAEVNCLEAAAFCKWKSEKLGKKVRLLAHEEGFHLRQNAKDLHANTNLNHYASPSPVDSEQFSGIVDGEKIYDIYGNVFRHSVSVLTCMRGFKTHPVYDDFSLPTLDGMHNHIIGGSFISMGDCARLNARYGFRRHFYQYAGIRYVHSPDDYSGYHVSVAKIADALPLGRIMSENYSKFERPAHLANAPKTSRSNITKHMLIEMLEGTGRDYEAVRTHRVHKLASNQFPSFLGQLAAKMIPDGSKVLVVHGSVGMVTLEIMKRCKHLQIDHTDTTANKIQILEQLIGDGVLYWQKQMEGELNELREYQLGDEDKQRIRDN